MGALDEDSTCFRTFQTAQTSDLARGPTTAAWLAQFDLPRPDGRPLYRYRLSKGAFHSLGEHLRTRVPIMRVQVVEADAALFVIWAAEWFRRVYAGGGEEWARLGTDLGLTCEQAQWRALADRGLRYWQIPALRLNRTHHRLVALARQGGFPLAALGDGSSEAKGWAARYLERLVGTLLSEEVFDDDKALTNAQALSDEIPTTWANRGMIEVCAELAAGIVRLRREAEAEGIGDGALAIAWLDAHRPRWRDDLPVALDDTAAQALLGGLMRAPAIKGGGGAISVRRILSFEGEARREQLEFALDGVLASDDPTALKSLGEQWSRLRLYPAGALAQYVGGELGTAVAGEGGVWTVRPSLAQARFEVPFAIAADVELRGDGVRVAGPFAVPGGGALRGGLLVLREDGDRYVVEGSGSGAFRADEVQLDMPSDWRAEGDDGPIEGKLRLGRLLARATGEVRVHTPDGDIYLIRTGQKADGRDRLVMVGAAALGCRSLDGAPLICGTPQLLVASGTAFRAAGGEGWWRRSSEKSWRPCAGALPPGPIDFAWRDRVSGHIRARAAAFVLPPQFRIERRVTGGTITLKVDGWTGSVTSSVGSPAGPGTWRVPVVPHDNAPPVLALGHEGGEPTRIAVALPQRAWLHDWHDGPVPRDRLISLATLHRHVARADGRCTLMADLIDSRGRSVAQGRTSWVVDDELAMAAVRDDIAALLRPLGDIRARVRLDFNDGHDNHWYVGEFDNELRQEPGGYLPVHAVADAGTRVMGRRLSTPAAAPRDFGPYALTDHRPIALPTLYGNWLIYLRADDRVLSRPCFHRGEPLAAPAPTRLGKAMAVEERGDRLAALNTLCDEVTASPQEMRTTLREVLDLTLSLDGLPPATFDILSLLAERPIVGALMLFAARESEVEAVMRLSDGLPFAWSLVPREAWAAAASTQAEAMFDAMPEASAMVGAAIGARRRRIAEIDPALRPLLDLRTDVTPLRDAANAFLNRSHDRIREGVDSPFRPEHQAALPGWDKSPIFWRALDAPVAAARNVQRRLQLAPEHIRCVKDIARTYPRWFAQGFAAALKED